MLGYIAAALLGVVFGSFATVLVARVPEGEGVARGRSRCRSCGQEIAWHDNIPLLSWVMLGGRCRHCKARISARYPLIEASVGALFVAVYAVWGISWTSLVFAYLAVISVALVAIDLEHHRLPHSMVLPSYGVVVMVMAVAWIAGERDTWWTAALGFAVLALFYGLLWFFYPKGLGFGDVTTAGLLGLAAGFLGTTTVAVAAIAGPLVGGLIIIGMAVSGRLKRGAAIAYGPALIVGAWMAYLAGETIARAYLRLVGVA